MAMKTSKRVIEARGQVEEEKLYAPLEAMRLLKKLPPPSSMRPSRRISVLASTRARPTR